MIQSPMSDLPPADVDVLAVKIATTLGETASEARPQIARALEQHGHEFVQSLVDEALTIERGGGMPLPDSSRKRTLGGVFFRLLRERTRPAERGTAPPPVGAPLSWDDRLEAVQAALARPGSARVVKTTVMGRPVETRPQDDFMVLTIPGTASLPSLPRGVPRPPSTATRYLVCIGGRQWMDVKQALQDPDDEVVATGYAIPNTKQNTIVVFASRVMTKLLRFRSPRGRPPWK
jgi:hypothetical protein